MAARGALYAGLEWFPRAWPSMPLPHLPTIQECAAWAIARIGAVLVLVLAEVRPSTAPEQTPPRGTQVRAFADRGWIDTLLLARVAARTKHCRIVVDTPPSRVVV